MRPTGLSETRQPEPLQLLGRSLHRLQKLNGSTPQNGTPMHFDHHYAKQTEFGRLLVDSTFTLALVTEQSVTDVSQNVFAYLGWDEVRLLNPGELVLQRNERDQGSLSPVRRYHNQKPLQRPARRQ